MLSPLLVEERAEVIRIAQKMITDGLVVGTSGNVSVRSGELVAVTPSGVDYDGLTVGDIAVVRLDGTLVEGDLPPTSELPMHLTAYVEHGVQAVVHTHSLHATALSLLRDDVPAVHYQLAEMGGVVRVAEYATFGTDQLARNMSAALEGRGACVLRNHGTVAVGSTPAAAYNRARQLEWLSELWLTARRAGEPSLLDDEELSRCAAQFHHISAR
ncbi:class II aldolase/adducin family protein [Saccharopolyspora sp. NFXS83]|uniref:class II aldolase/adducin family protein n=1 Tax=Saccharopolyspora sp. NFXS83 TaxID=2993560 RepID=UPI00224B1091|nr:class II aldolase/adducin family protein [Saccharopolyspora sp. NFXS83]MCX2733029.1 class II aldolase/adducin family protein [Saccharopolyspora sp. NFXS83]